MQPLGVMVSAATPSPEWLTRHPGPEPALRCSELSPGELPVLLASPQTGGSSRCRFVDNLIFNVNARPRQCGASSSSSHVTCEDTRCKQLVSTVSGISLDAGGPSPSPQLLNRLCFDKRPLEVPFARLWILVRLLDSRLVGLVGPRVVRWKCPPPCQYPPCSAQVARRIRP